jgi:hypothetical protein
MKQAMNTDQSVRETPVRNADSASAPRRKSPTFDRVAFAAALEILG